MLLSFLFKWFTVFMNTFEILSLLSSPDVDVSSVAVEDVYDEITVSTCFSLLKWG